MGAVMGDTRAYKLSRDEIAQALSEFMVKKARLKGEWEAFRIEIVTDDRKALRPLWLCDLNPESTGIGLGFDSAVLSLQEKAVGQHRPSVQAFLDEDDSDDPSAG
jgi:hypothetical protein